MQDLSTATCSETEDCLNVAIDTHLEQSRHSSTPEVVVDAEATRQSKDVSSFDMSSHIDCIWETAESTVEHSTVQEAVDSCIPDRRVRIYCRISRHNVIKC